MQENTTGQQRDPLTCMAIELQSLAQAGLFYGKDPYDREPGMSASGSWQQSCWP